MAKPFRGYWTFFTQFRSNFETTGSIVPSSPFLAEALTRYVHAEPQAADAEPRTILEVGPGTGPVTQRLADLLGAYDRLDLVEANDAFVEVLQKRFDHEPRMQRVRDRTRILHHRIEELPLDQKYHLIISGLPLNNFAVVDVERIIDVLSQLLHPGGTLSFFEYAGVRKLRGLVSGAEDRDRLNGISRALRLLLEPFEIRRDLVWLNFPPAWVHHVRMTAAPERE